MKAALVKTDGERLGNEFMSVFFDSCPVNCMEILIVADLYVQRGAYDRHMADVKLDT